MYGVEFPSSDSDRPDWKSTTPVGVQFSNMQQTLCTSTPTRVPVTPKDLGTTDHTIYIVMSLISIPSSIRLFQQLSGGMIMMNTQW